MDRLKAKGAYLYATQQLVDTSITASKAFFDMLGVFVEFETNLRRERQAEGIAAARKRGMNAGFAFEPVFRISIPASDGTAFNLDKDRFEFLAEHYGLQPSDFGREFRTGSERFRITGIDPKRPRYPISVERIPDRKGFKFTAKNVAMLLQAQRKS